MLRLVVVSEEQAPLVVVPGAHATQSRVPSCENLYPEDLVESLTGL